jgi:hypothetical protein
MAWYKGEDVNISELIGKTIVAIIKDDNRELDFICSTGEHYKMYHSQDCCESVSIEDICGDLHDLHNSTIINAEKISNDENPKSDDGYIDESCTWTFYKISSAKGCVTIRWYGESNGYYSEEVDFIKMENDK